MVSSENKRQVLSCQHLLNFAVDLFATCFDPYLGHPHAYMNAWCQISQLCHLFNINSYSVYTILIIYFDILNS
jgi:hypothetical protein